MDSIELKVKQALQYLEIANETDYIGEPVSQLEHALQAAYFAELATHSEEVILASLFHDIGHFASQSQQHYMAELGIMNHEWIGAKLLYELGFSAKVACLMGYHVEAKRYLAAKKPRYHALLSEASKQTLVFQGGVMTHDEQLAFERHVYFKEILQVRVNDEKSKVLGLKVPDLNYYQPLIKKHITIYQNKRHALDENNTIPNFVDSDWVNKLKIFLNKAV